ncbi:MAG: VOC family protein [Myxococcaceae bacterium]
MAPEARHFHLASRNHATSRAFYGKYFGFKFDSTFTRDDRPAATIIRSPGGFQIYLEGPSETPLPSWFHFGFLVESARACQGLYQRMQIDQIRIVHPLVVEPFSNYFFADPDENLVQVYFDSHAQR